MPRIPEADWVDIREDMTDEEVVAALLAHLRRARTRYTTVVCREARARLTAPMRLEMRAVHDFILKKLAWLRKTVRKQRLALQAGASSVGASPSVPFLDSRILDGGFVYFFGRRLTLRQGAGALYRFNLQTITLEIPALTGAGELSAKDEFASRTALWLMDAFENVLAGFARRFRARLAAAPQAHRALREVRLSQATTRWGSCTIKGSIRINGREMSSLSRQDIAGMIALVPQNPFLIAGTIYENICYGTDKEVSEAEVEEAAKKACIYDFINSLPEKFNTQIAEGGGNLSGGQKQRIAIARIFLRRPEIVILDEATSALDNTSERYIQREIERMKEQDGVTVLSIAHRLTTLENCDEILVFDQGHICQRGKYEDLIGQKGLFRDMYHGMAAAGANVSGAR